MGVDYSASIALTERQHEQWGALALLQSENTISVNEVLVEATKMEGLLFVIGRKLNVFPVDALNEEILGKNPLLLDARWSNVNFIANWAEWTENSSINFEKDLASTKTLCNNWVLSVQHCN